MKITVNRTELTVFDGARVADAVRQYYARHKRAIPKVMPEMMDKYGNMLASDGRLSEGNKIIINSKKDNR